MRSVFANLLFVCSTFFYVFAAISIINRYYEVVFFLILDGLLFTGAGYFVKHYIHEKELPGPKPGANRKKYK